MLRLLLSLPQLDSGGSKDAVMVTTADRWAFASQRLAKDRIEYKAIGERISFAEATAALANDRDARELATTLTATLMANEFREFFFECPPVSRATLATTPFKFVLVDASASPLTAAPSAPDPGAFGEWFAKDNSDVAHFATFPNLGRDAMLVALRPPRDPTADLDESSCVTLASFMRKAPRGHAVELWEHIGVALSSRLASLGNDHIPVWLSTSGLGVSWLHVRLDSRPKYYQHNPYRTFAGD